MCPILTSHRNKQNLTSVNNAQNVESGQSIIDDDDDASKQVSHTDNFILASYIGMRGSETAYKPVVSKLNMKIGHSFDIFFILLNQI